MACDCPPKVTDSDECLASIIPYKSACCFTWQEIGVNLICALRDIAAAIREYIISQPVVVATGVMHWEIEDYGSLVNDGMVEIELFVSNFDLEIVGIGVGYLGDFGAQGIYTTDDRLHIALINESTNAQIGNTLILKNTQKHDEHANAGEVIGQNIAEGNTAMLRIRYHDTEGSTFDPKKFDFYMFIRPLQLQAP